MTKKVLFALINLFLMVSTFATNKDFEKDITMVSYEQGCFELEGTIALRNNTEEEVHDVVFRIVYLDMSGEQLDYKDFSKKVSIDPGMTKKINVTAYEYERGYHYYKTKKTLPSSPEFKIKFVLKDYNVEKSEGETEKKTEVAQHVYNTNTPMPHTSLPIILPYIVGALIVGFIAHRFNRSVALWVLLTLVISPLLSAIILLAMGKKKNA